MDKYDSINLETYRLIEPNKKVLDVGCATGKLGEKIKREKNCYIVGIEVDKELAEKAKPRCDQVIIADIETLEELPFDSNYFDIIIFNDILEHTRDPIKIIKKYKKCLLDGGYILLSIPNIANWMIRLNLLFGKFEYTDAGILDRTHLKFFTLKSAKELLIKSSFKIEYIGNYNTKLRLLGRLWKTMFAHQFIIKASPINDLVVK